MPPRMLMAASTRRIALAAATLAIAGGVVLWRAQRHHSEEGAGLEGALAQAPAPRDDARVLSAAPGVERSVEGGWTQARPGDALRLADTVRTGKGSTAEIALGRGARLTISETSELSVREISAAAQRVKLVRGRIGVELRPDGTRVLRVEDPSGAVSASVTGGRFGFVASGGSLAVAASEGEARVEAGGAAVDVPAGSETIAWRGAAPLAPRRIPRDLVLRVASRIEERRATVCAVIQVAVASQLSVNGEDVPVPADGVVALHAPVRSRARGVDVVLRHASGVVERQRVPCAEDEGAVSDIEVRWNAR